MRALHLGFALVLTASGFAHAAERAPSPDPKNITGVWWVVNSDGSLKPQSGDIPFTEAGKARYERVRAGLKQGSVDDYAEKYCAAPGVPRVMTANYPLEIIQTEGQVTILHEYDHAYRRVILGAKHAPEDEAVLTYMGDTSGRWDGDVLVIDTVSMTDKTWLDATGVPHGEKLHVVERIRKIEGGRQLENLVTVDDPETFTRPWSARLVYAWRPDVVLEEYVCGETHRSVSQPR